MIPRKHHFWSFLAITIAVRQIQMILILIPLQNEHDGMGICAKQQDLKATFEVAVECSDETQQETVFNLLTKEGYKCRILTM